MAALSVTLGGASVTFSLDEVKALASVAVPDGKIAGKKGASVATVLEAAKAKGLAGLAGPTSAVFAAFDGVQTSPVSAVDLPKGILAHSEADGTPLSRGGPLRLTYPAGVAIQKSVCKKEDGPAELKSVVRIELSPAQ